MKISTRSIVVAGVMIAISGVLALTGLGYFPLPNVTGAATIMQIPAIIAGVIAGPIAGLIVGVVFAVNAYTSFVGLPFFAGTPFWVPIVVLSVPRLFIGPVAWLLYKSLAKPNRLWGMVVATIIAAGITVSLVALLVPKGEFVIPADDVPGMERTYVLLTLALTGVLAAAIATAIYQWFQSSGETTALAAAGIAGTLTNTVLVLSLGILLTPLGPELYVISLPQAVVEMAIAAVITVAVVVAWKRIETGRGGSSV